MSIWRDETHPEIQFSYSPKRPYATFIFNYHPPGECGPRSSLPQH